jgi:hypothetical protein
MDIIINYKTKNTYGIKIEGSAIMLYQFDNIGEINIDINEKTMKQVYRFE